MSHLIKFINYLISTQSDGVYSQQWGSVGYSGSDFSILLQMYAFQF